MFCRTSNLKLHIKDVKSIIKPGKSKRSPIASCAHTPGQARSAVLLRLELSHHASGRVKHRGGILTRQFSRLLPPYDDAQPSRDVAFSGVAAFTSRSGCQLAACGHQKTSGCRSHAPGRISARNTLKNERVDALSQHP